MTSAKIHPKPAAFDAVVETVDSWLALPHVRILYPGDRNWHFMRQLGSATHASGNFVTDVSIAALALEHGGTVYTNDHHFARFAQLPCRYPLQP